MDINTLGKLLRLVPSGIPGRVRLVRLLGSRFADSGPASFRVKGMVFFVPSLREPVAFSLWSSGSYEPEIQKLIGVHWKQGTTFVDVGANIGAVSIPLIKALKDRGGVIGIEASPTIYPYLKRNLIENQCTSFEALQCAACDQEGKSLEFNEAPDEKFGMGSLGTSFGKPSVQVNGRMIDNILIERGWPEVSVIKVDVEGFEAAVFIGARRLLEQQRPVVIFEFCDWAEKNSRRFQVGESQTVLLSMGYSLYELGAKKLIPIKDIMRKGYANIIAVHGEVMTQHQKNR